MSKFKSLLDELNIDETLTKLHSREKTFTKIKNNIPREANYNLMADVLFLPTDKNGYKYLLVVVDLATNAFDIEPMKTKDAPTALTATKKIFKRKYVKKPYASIRTDAGTEFQGVFHKWLYDESIFHSVAKEGRHKQLANVESLNRTLGRLFNGYMNTIEIETKKSYREWTKVVPIIREKLNKIRYMKPGNSVTYDYPVQSYSVEPKYKVGDIVHVKLDEPENALGEKQPTKKFRMGDIRYDSTPRKITKVLYYTGGDSPYRYLVTGIKRTSYSEKELIPAEEEKEEYEVKQILDKIVEDGQTWYLVWYKGEKKAEASWQPERNVKDTAPLKIKEFNDNNNKKNKNKK